MIVTEPAFLIVTWLPLTVATAVSELAYVTGNADVAIAAKVKGRSP